MAFTKDTARHDYISIDGTDVSNSFRGFGLSSVHSEEDASGFSVSGTDETLPGSTAQGFTGEAFHTPELVDIIWPLHIGRTTCHIVWQPQGLVDTARESWAGDCIIFEFGPETTRGTVRVMPFTARTSTSTGLVFTTSGT